MADGFSWTSWLRLLLPLVGKLFPWFRRLYAEKTTLHEENASQLPITQESFQITLRRLAGAASDDPFFQQFIIAVERSFLSPTGKFEVTAVQEWLREPNTEENFSRLAASQVGGYLIDQDQIKQNLVRSYTEKTGEHESYAHSVISVVIETVVTGVTESMTESDRAAAGLIMRKMDENTITDPITVQAHTQAVKQELDLVCKKRDLYNFKETERISILVKRVSTQGDLRSCDQKIKSDAFYWAARLHAREKKNLKMAKNYLNQLEKLSPDYNQSIPKAWVAHHEGRDDEGIALLSKLEDPDGRSNLLSMLWKYKNAETALQWWEHTNPNGKTGWLTPRGYRILSVVFTQLNRWEDAANLLNGLPEEFCHEYIILPYITGIINMAVFIPDRFRKDIEKLDLIPSSAPELEPLSMENLQQWKMKALSAFNKAKQIGEQLDEPLLRSRAQAWIAWLKLTDPLTRKDGEVMVIDAMTDGPTALEFIALARVFKIPIDTTPLSRHLKSLESLGHLKNDNRRAEIDLMRYRNNQNDLEIYLTINRNIILESIAPASYCWLLIDTLLQNEKFEQAKIVFDEYSELFGDEDQGRLRDLIQAACGQDIKESLLLRYKRTWEDIDLHNLCFSLQQSGDYEKLRAYSAELCRRTPTPEHIWQHAECLFRLRDDYAIIDFLEKHAVLVGHDSELLNQKAWTCFFLGRMEDARNALEQKALLAPSPIDDGLRQELALHEGRWEELPTILVRVQRNRDHFRPSELIRFAHVTADHSPNDAIALLESLVANNPIDIIVLRDAGFLASRLGRDDIAMPWLARSQQLSTETDSLWQQYDLKETMELMINRSSQINEINRKWTMGEITIHQFCHWQNITLTAVLVQAAIANTEKIDPRHRSALSIRPGNRLLWQTASIKEVAVDITTLILLSSLDLIPAFFQRFETIYLPWSLMAQLLQEQTRLRYHQPSQIKNAKRIVKLVEDQKAVVPICTETPPEWLVREVGNEDAELFTIAKSTNGRMVHPLPVRKLLEFDGKSSDLGEYADALLTLRQMVSWMRQAGLLDSTTIDKAEHYVHGVDTGEPLGADYDGMAPLYFSSLAIIELLNSGVLEALAGSNRQVFFSKTSIEQAKELIRYEENATQSIELLNALRIKLRDAIQSGKIRLFPRQIKHSSGNMAGMIWEEIYSHFKDGQGICVDDRLLGRFANIHEEERNCKAVLLDTVDLLHDFTEAKIIQPSDLYAKLYELRRRGFQFIPADEQELLHLLKAASIDPLTEQLQESAELRAIRESWFRFRSLGMLSNLDEAHYAEAMGTTAMIVAHSLWQEINTDVVWVKAASSWLYQILFTWPWDWPMLLDNQEWKNKFLEQKLHLLALMIISNSTPDKVQQHGLLYHDWLQSQILEPLTLSAPDVLDQMTGNVKASLEKMIDQFNQQIRSKMAQFILSNIPDLLSSRIHKDHSFLKRLGLDQNFQMSLFGAPSISVQWYVSAMQDLYKKQSPVSLSVPDGQKLILSLNAGTIFLEYDDGSGKSLRTEPNVLKLLAPDLQLRIQGFEKLIENFLHTHSNVLTWRQLLEDRPLSDAEFILYLNELNDSPSIFMRKFIDTINHGNLEFDLLIPYSLNYFESLCGQWTEGSDLSEFEQNILLPHRHRLASHPKLINSLEIILPMSLRDDLSPATLFEKIDNDTLWKAFQNIGLRNDPFGLLGQLDICLARADLDDRYAIMAETIFNQFANMDSEQSPLHERIALFSGFASLLDQELPLLPEMAKMPFFWRRVCGWTHAGMLTHILTNRVNSAPFSQWLQNMAHPLGHLAKYLDLRQAPRINFIFNSHFMLRWELESRVLLTLQRYPKMAEMDTYRSYIERWKNPENLQPFMLFPGPLEEANNAFPLQNNNEEVAKFVFSMFEKEGTDLWGTTWKLILFFGLKHKLPEASINQITDIVHTLKFGEGEEQKKQALNGLILLCTLAVQQQDNILADSIFSLINAEGQKAMTVDETDQYISAAIILMAAYQEISDGMIKLSEFMASLAQTLPSKDMLNTLNNILEQLRRLIPVSLWHFQVPDAWVKSIHY
ncbi:MAG: hypothetical protein HQL99_10820 [Magnetococcales bacterium]|nr:hypothetical protein [Magnetococcales bacterium]